MGDDGYELIDAVDHEGGAAVLAEFAVEAALDGKDANIQRRPMTAHTSASKVTSVENFGSMTASSGPTTAVCGFMNRSRWPDLSTCANSLAWATKFRAAPMIVLHG